MKNKDRNKAQNLNIDQLMEDFSEEIGAFDEGMPEKVGESFGQSSPENKGESRNRHTKICFYHPMEEAVQICTSCGKPLCRHCLISYSEDKSLNENYYCRECYGKILIEDIDHWKRQRNKLTKSLMIKALITAGAAITLLITLFSQDKPIGLLIPAELVVIVSVLLWFTGNFFHITGADSIKGKLLAVLTATAAGLKDLFRIIQKQLTDRKHLSIMIDTDWKELESLKNIGTI